MQESQAIIERVRRVAPTVLRLEVAVHRAHGAIGGGQLLLARVAEQYDPYLREMWQPIARRSETQLIIERPAVRDYTPGATVSLIGPVGKPIPLREGGRALLLVAAEASPTALLFLANAALAKGAAVALVLIGAAGRYPLEALPQEIEVHRVGDYATWPERDRMLTWADQVVATAPPPLDTPIYVRLAEDLKRIRLQPPPELATALFQMPMPCGVGACQACLVRIGGEDVPACTDGPGFNLFSVKLGG
jgi:dihydroorotate dehydrogenase electron transfer subunit